MAVSEDFRGVPEALRLLADVFESGLIGSVRARLLDAGIEASGPIHPDDLVQARYQALFGFAVPPYAGVFLDEEGLTGRAVESAMARMMASHHLVPSDAGPSLEHVSGLARAVAMLMEVPAMPAAGEAAENLCLSWFPALSTALRSEGGDDYAELLDVLIEILAPVVSARRTTSGKEADPEVGDSGLAELFGPARLVDREPPLTESRAGVRDLAEYLTRHALTGVYVGRRTVQRLARASDSPAGFGGRALMLGNLLNSAASYGGLDGTLGLLREEAETYRARWVEWGSRDDVPASWAREWIRRIERTVEALEAVGEAVRGEAPNA